MNAEKLAAILILAATPLSAQTVISHGRIANTTDAPPAAFAQTQGLDDTYGSLPVARIKDRSVQETKFEVLNPVSNMCEEHISTFDQPDFTIPVACKVQHPYLDKDSAIGAVFSACDGYGTTDNMPDCNELSFWFPELKADGDNVVWNGQVVATVHRGVLTSSLKLKKGFHLVPRLKETGYVYQKSVRRTAKICEHPLDSGFCPEPEVDTPYVDRTYTPVTLVQVDLVADDGALQAAGNAASK